MAAFLFLKRFLVESSPWRGGILLERRIEDHPILDFDSSGTITIYFEGVPLKARPTDTIASALIANGIDIFGWTEDGKPRGFFCAIGKCSSCLVVVDGIPNVRACITPVKDGMRVERQRGRGKAVW